MSRRWLTASLALFALSSVYLAPRLVRLSAEAPSPPTAPASAITEVSEVGPDIHRVEPPPAPAPLPMSVDPMSELHAQPIGPVAAAQGSDILPMTPARTPEPPLIPEAPAPRRETGF